MGGGNIGGEMNVTQAQLGLGPFVGRSAVSVAAVPRAPLSVSSWTTWGPWLVLVTL